MGETAVLYTSLIRYQNNLKSRFPQQGVKGYIHKDLVGGNLIAASTALVRRDSFDRYGLFDEGLACLVDWELWLRLSSCYHFNFLDEPLVTAYSLPDGVTGEDTAVLDALQQIIAKHRVSFEQDKQQLAHYYYVIGHHLCLEGVMANGRRYVGTGHQSQLVPTEVSAGTSSLVFGAGHVWGGVGEKINNQA